VATLSVFRVSVAITPPSDPPCEKVNIESDVAEERHESAAMTSRSFTAAGRGLVSHCQQKVNLIASIAAWISRRGNGRRTRPEPGTLMRAMPDHLVVPKSRQCVRFRMSPFTFVFGMAAVRR
jgi:hypothetical protein